MILRTALSKISMKRKFGSVILKAREKQEGIKVRKISINKRQPTTGIEIVGEKAPERIF
jgi:hypothetical protein